VLRLLDTLKSTATGFDEIPAWFLRLGAPIFAAPLARLFDQMIIEGTVPQQWKTACITPIPKVPHPTKPSEFRPILVTPVLSRSFEKYVVRYYCTSTQHSVQSVDQLLDFMETRSFMISFETCCA